MSLHRIVRSKLVEGHRARGSDLDARVLDHDQRGHGNAQAPPFEECQRRGGGDAPGNQAVATPPRAPRRRAAEQVGEASAEATVNDFFDHDRAPIGPQGGNAGSPIAPEHAGVALREGAPVQVDGLGHELLAELAEAQAP